jgi:hypothetical protein
MVFLSCGRIIARGTALEITQAILDAKRDKPALVEAFLHVAGSSK